MENTPSAATPEAAPQGPFHAGLTVGAAMQMHPRAREVFAGFHLGGCAHCSISEFETIQQICEGYGVPAEMLLGALNSLAQMEPVKQA